MENATKRGEQGLRELRALEQAHPRRSVRISPPLVIEEGLMATGLGIMADAMDALDRRAAGSPGV